MYYFIALLGNSHIMQLYGEAAKKYGDRQTNSRPVAEPSPGQ